MTVNINSWHFKLYAFAFNKRKDNYGFHNKPKSLCAYFWTVVLSILYAPILFTFNYVLGGISALFFNMVRVTTPLEVEDCDVTDRSDRKQSAWFFILLLIIISVLFNLVNMLVLGYGWKFYDYGDMILAYTKLPWFFRITYFGSTVLLVICVVIGTLGGIVWFFVESKTFKNIIYFFTSNLFIQYLKAVKNKACPIIEYVDPNKVIKDSGSL